MKFNLNSFRAAQTVRRKIKDVTLVFADEQGQPAFYSMSVNYDTYSPARQEEINQIWQQRFDAPLDTEITAAASDDEMPVAKPKPRSFYTVLLSELRVSIDEVTDESGIPIILSDEDWNATSTQNLLSIEEAIRFDQKPNPTKPSN